MPDEGGFILNHSLKSFHYCLKNTLFGKHNPSSSLDLQSLFPPMSKVKGRGGGCRLGGMGKVGEGIKEGEQSSITLFVKPKIMTQENLTS